MNKIDIVKEKYINKGVAEKHIMYAFQSIRNKSEREFVLKNLTSDIRNVDVKIAAEMLDDIIGLNVPFYKYSKKKLGDLKINYNNLGVKDRHIYYAFNEISKGKENSLILKDLVSSYREVNEDVAEKLIEDLNKLQFTFIVLYSLVVLLGVSLLLGAGGFLFIMLKFETAGFILFIPAIILIFTILKIIYHLSKQKIANKKFRGEIK